jgi:outer membrane lipoprotein-sorting protein
MRTFLLAFLFCLPAAFADVPVDLAPVKKWIARQDEFRSVAADFTQTRALRVLKDPVATPGRLWFTAAGALRWELGSPAKTIVVRKGDDTLIINPAKKTAERQPAEGSPGARPGIGAMMRFPLARDFADFQRQFEVLALSSANNRTRMEIAPRDPQTRKFMKVIKIEFDSANGHLHAFEMAFKDGSSLRNEFSNVRVNQKFARDLFEYDLTGYEVKDARN